MKTLTSTTLAACIGLFGSLCSTAAWAIFETSVEGNTKAWFRSNGASPDVDDFQYFDSSIGRVPRARIGYEVSRAGGDIRVQTSPGVWTQRTDVAAVAVASALADHGVVRAEANAQSGGGVTLFNYDTNGQSYEQLWFNKGAEATVAADTWSRRLVLGAPGTSGQITFSGFVEGTLFDNQRVFFDPRDPFNRRTSVAQANFWFSAGVNDSPGLWCFTVGNGCRGVNQRLTFDKGVQSASATAYRESFSVTLAVSSGQEIQTWMHLNVYAAFIGHAAFGNSGHLTEIQVSDGLSLDNSDGLLVRNGNSYSLLNTSPVPEPGTWALWLAGLAGVMLRLRRGFN